MRSSRREKSTTSTAPAAAAHDVDFGYLWRQLRVAGRTSKKPTGIQTEWTYTSPENDVLVGERAVVEFAFQPGLLIEYEGDSAGESDGTGEHMQDEHVAEEVGSDGGDDGGNVDATIRPSQIDTSVLLLQNSVVQLFGPDSDASEPDLSQNAVARAFDLSQRDRRADEEHRDAAASL
ncbi:hypothetical protein P3T76_007424 [Phytophthora citrophthora]|uniref:Uncharacterized protein n=1 Tax=Phytophthora citrophthora TaxID=4793 RepID=A0AAD9LLR2_9STRA|nr:hypothetical protein P3T76_007424 [Phytophthora citrophthora]